MYILQQAISLYMELLSDSDGRLELHLKLFIYWHNYHCSASPLASY